MQFTESTLKTYTLTSNLLRFVPTGPHDCKPALILVTALRWIFEHAVPPYIWGRNNHAIDMLKSKLFIKNVETWHVIGWKQNQKPCSLQNPCQLAWISTWHFLVIMPLAPSYHICSIIHCAPWCYLSDCTEYCTKCCYIIGCSYTGLYQTSEEFRFSKIVTPVSSIIATTRCKTRLFFSARQIVYYALNYKWIVCGAGISAANLWHACLSMYTAKIRGIIVQ